MVAFLDRHVRRQPHYAARLAEPLDIDLFIGLDWSRVSSTALYKLSGATAAAESAGPLGTPNMRSSDFSAVV